jgi:hypothetical protein
MMPIPKNPNIVLLEAAVERLGPLIDEVVFLGGCAAGFLLTDPAAPPLRVKLLSSLAGEQIDKVE